MHAKNPFFNSSNALAQRHGDTEVDDAVVFATTTHLAVSNHYTNEEAIRYLV